MRISRRSLERQEVLFRRPPVGWRRREDTPPYRFLSRETHDPTVGGDRPPGNVPDGMSKIKFRGFPQNYRELYQNRRTRIKRDGSFVGRLTTEYTETPLATRNGLAKRRLKRKPAHFNTIYKRDEGWLRKAEGPISPTAFRVRRAASVFSVVANPSLCPSPGRTRQVIQIRRARIERGGGKVGKWNGGKVAAIRCRGGYAGYVSRNPSTDGSMGLWNHAPGIAKPPNLHDIADHDIIDGEVSNVYAVVNIACIWIRIVWRKGKRCIKAIQNSPLGIIPQPLRCIRTPQPERDVPNSLGYLIVKLRRILKSKPAAQHPRSPASQKTPLRVTFVLGSRGKSANIPKAVPYRCRNPNRQENIYNLPQA